MVSTPGGASAHTSSTRHGAWSTTKRAAGPEAARTQPRVVAVAREHEHVHALGGRHHLAPDAPAAALGARLAPEALARLGQQRLGGLVGDGAQRRGAVRAAGVPARPSSPWREPSASVSTSPGATCSSVTSASAGRNAAASATVASQVSSTIQTSARISGQALRAEP